MDFDPATVVSQRLDWALASGNEVYEQSTVFTKDFHHSAADVPPDQAKPDSEPGTDPEWYPRPGPTVGIEFGPEPDREPR